MWGYDKYLNKHQLQIQAEKRDLGAEEWEQEADLNQEV